LVIIAAAVVECTGTTTAFSLAIVVLAAMSAHECNMNITKETGAPC